MARNRNTPLARVYPIARAAPVALGCGVNMMVKAVVAGIAFGAFLSHGVSVPPEIWPLFGFIVVVYGLMAAWELRGLLAERQAQVEPAGVAKTGQARQRPLPAQTRSSTA